MKNRDIGGLDAPEQAYRRSGLRRMSPHLFARIGAAGLAALLAVLVAACTTLGPLPPPPTHPNGAVLWGLVHDKCVPDQRDHGAPAPCALVSLGPGEAHGFVVLKDRAGVAQHLILPTANVTGIEDPLILAPGAANYFAAAWSERHFVEDKLGHPLRRDQLSIAVNSIYGRSQDQLHLHLDCIDAAVGAAVQAGGPAAAARWPGAALTLKGHAYRVRWIAGEDPAGANPFELLAREAPGAPKTMGAWTLVLIGATRADGALGFYLLADRADPAAGDMASGEDLQDHACRLVP